jgi:hypothetical protein
VEVFILRPPEGPETEVIQDQKVNADKGAEAAVKRVGCTRCMELSEHFVH